MSGSRRTGSPNSKTRAQLLDATERLMLEGGYPAVTSRNVATAAGVTPPLIHYYFPTLDDLFLALFRRGAEVNLGRYNRVLSSRRPLHALWELSVEPTGTALLTEFMALATHRTQIRDEIAEYAIRFRQMQVSLVEQCLRDRNVDFEQVPPAAVLVIIACLSRGMVLEQELGVTVGHTDTFAFVQRLLNEMEGDEPDEH